MEITVALVSQIRTSRETTLGTGILFFSPVLLKAVGGRNKGRKTGVGVGLRHVSNTSSF
jgi:hypothetical protein